jgi:hypothetical protein
MCSRNDDLPRPDCISSAPLHIIRRFTQYYRNDYVGVEQWSRTIVSGQYVHLVSLHQQHERFAKVWDNNLRLQGFAEAFEQQQTPRA